MHQSEVTDAKANSRKMDYALIKAYMKACIQFLVYDRIIERNLRHGIGKIQAVGCAFLERLVVEGVEAGVYVAKRKKHGRSDCQKPVVFCRFLCCQRKRILTKK